MTVEDTVKYVVEVILEKEAELERQRVFFFFRLLLKGDHKIIIKSKIGSSSPINKSF